MSLYPLAGLRTGHAVVASSVFPLVWCGKQEGTIVVPLHVLVLGEDSSVVWPTNKQIGSINLMYNKENTSVNHNFTSVHTTLDDAIVPTHAVHAVQSAQVMHHRWLKLT